MMIKGKENKKSMRCLLKVDIIRLFPTLKMLFN